MKALELLINGSEDLQPRVFERVFLASASALVRAGIPYHLIEGALSSPSINSLIRLSAHIARALELGRCFDEVMLKVVSFSLHVENGNIGRAREIAEEVLIRRSAFFGAIMISTINLGSRKYSPHSSGLEIPEEVLEKLISVLKEHDIDIGEVLAKYSLSELMELYEKLGGALEPALLLLEENRRVTSAGLPRQNLLEVDADEDTLRYSAVTDSQGRNGLAKDVSSHAKEEVVSEQEIGKLVNRIPYQVVVEAFKVVSSASYREANAGGSQLSSRDLLGRAPSEDERLTDWVLLFSMIVIAISVGGLSPIVLRRGTSRPVSLRKALEVGDTGTTITDLNPVVKFFWNVVDLFTATAKVRVLPSDTHREIVEKLGVKADDVESAALRRLCKLYEAVRYSGRAVPDELLRRELKVLRKLLLEEKSARG